MLIFLVLDDLSEQNKDAPVSNPSGQSHKYILKRAVCIVMMQAYGNHMPLQHLFVQLTMGELLTGPVLHGELNNKK
jgi:hypothetical protein